MGIAVELRPMRVSDLSLMHEIFSDPVSMRQAAFTNKDQLDREAYCARWARLLEDPTVRAFTVMHDDEIVGSIARYEIDAEPQVTYGFAREHWGKGIGSAALRAFLEIVTERPIHAAAASDNLASLTVLRRCGFEEVRTERGFAEARGEEIEETILLLQ